MPKFDCLGNGAGLYSPPSQASAVINQSQLSPAVRRNAYANSADIGYRSERRKEFLRNITASRRSCSTNNIIVVEEAGFRGWRLKASCPGGTTLFVKVDLNGEASEIDVQE
jgi:hypothetical protein